MSISSRYKELFHTSTISDKLTLFQLLFDTKELTVDLTLALLKVIHKELSIHQTRDRSGYKRYAEAIESLRYHMSDVLRQVIHAWKTEQGITPAEWFAHDNPTSGQFKDK
jgi:hypothetical protein